VAVTRAQAILAGLVGAGVEHADDADLTELLLGASVGALPVDGCGLSLFADQAPQMTVAATDERARLLEELQFTLGEGPCIDAFSQGRPVSQPELAATGPRRWPGFGPAALDAGVRAVWAFPLQLGGIRLGVLDLYRETAGMLDVDQTAEALAFADAATLLLLYLQEQAPPGGLHPVFDGAWSLRAEVHQATGMISVQAGVGLSAALLLLRAHAFGNGRPIGQVAADVVNRRLKIRPGT
jgi:hypothetical protein